MNQILLTLGALTLGGSAAVLLLAWMGSSTRGRYGAKWRCWAWLLLCLRLAVPLPLVFRGETRAPIQVDVPNPPAVTQPVTPPNTPNVPAPPNTGDHSGPAAGSQGGTILPKPGTSSSAGSPVPRPEENPSFDAARLLLAVWLAGAAAMLLWSGYAHLRFLSYLRRWSAPVEDWDAVAAFNHLGDQLQLHTRPRLLFEVPPSCFLPAPKVTSAVVRLVPRPAWPEVDDPAHFFRVVRAAFAQRRKTLLNSLASVFGGQTSREALLQAIERCGLPADIRGERLSIPQFAQLSRRLRGSV